MLSYDSDYSSFTHKYLLTMPSQALHSARLPSAARFLPFRRLIDVAFITPQEIV